MLRLYFDVWYRLLPAPLFRYRRHARDNVLAIHFHKNLVYVPLPFRECPQLLNTLSSDLGGKHRAEPVPPKAYCFMAYIDPTLVQQIFDITKRKQKSDVHHHREADDLGIGFEMLE